MQNLGFGVRVDRGQCIVEEHDARPSREGTSQRRSLFLTAGEVDPPFSQHGVESAGKLFDCLRKLGNASRPPTRLFR